MPLTVDDLFPKGEFSSSSDDEAPDKLQQVRQADAVSLHTRSNESVLESDVVSPGPVNTVSQSFDTKSMAVGSDALSGQDDCLHKAIAKNLKAKQAMDAVDAADQSNSTSSNSSPRGSSSSTDSDEQTDSEHSDGDDSDDGTDSEKEDEAEMPKEEKPKRKLSCRARAPQAKCLCNGRE